MVSVAVSVASSSRGGIVLKYEPRRLKNHAYGFDVRTVTTSPLTLTDSTYCLTKEPLFVRASLPIRSNVATTSSPVRSRSGIPSWFGATRTPGRTLKLQVSGSGFSYDSARSKKKNSARAGDWWTRLLYSRGKKSVEPATPRCGSNVSNGSFSETAYRPPRRAGPSGLRMAGSDRPPDCGGHPRGGG